jgi:hypothetical protein
LSRTMRQFSAWSVLACCREEWIEQAAVKPEIIDLHFATA